MLIFEGIKISVELEDRSCSKVVTILLSLEEQENRVVLTRFSYLMVRLFKDIINLFFYSKVLETLF
jgi:hypothetical protein